MEWSGGEWNGVTVPAGGGDGSCFTQKVYDANVGDGGGDRSCFTQKVYCTGGGDSGEDGCEGVWGVSIRKKVGRRLR